MLLKTTITALLLNTAFTLLSYGQVVTRKHGNWFDPDTWEGNKVPNNDEVIVVNHRVVMDSTRLFIQQVTVEKKGQICGEVDITMVSGTLINHGLIRINQLTFQSNFINSGTLEVRKMKTDYWKGFTNTGKVSVNKNMEIKCKH